MGQRLTLDPSSFERLLAAALVLQCRQEQEACHLPPALDETRAHPPGTEAEPHRAFEHDTISARPIATFSASTEAAETRADQNAALERAAAVSRAEQLIPPLEKQAGEQKRVPHGSSFGHPKTEKILGWRLPPQFSRRIASSFWLAQLNQLARLAEFLRDPRSPWLNALRSARRALHRANLADAVKNLPASLARYRIKAWVTFNSKFVPSQRRAVTKAAAPLLVLLIMVAFTLTQVWPRGHFLTVAAVSRMNHPSDEATVRKAVQFRPAPPDQISHMQVTDRVALSVVDALSRYEIPGLRRQAEYGDESAAFIMGMVYETGHFVPQSCTKAATWVTSSANAGNAAAQYNLGLRYRDGDGVPANENEAEEWLRKAADQRYSHATLALEQPPAASP